MALWPSRAPWARWLVRAVVSGVVIAVLLVVVPLDAVVGALGRVSAWTWIASVAIFFGGHYLNAIKLRLLLGDLGAAGPQATAACVRAQYAGLVANLGLPGLAGGDLVRAAYLAPTVGMARVTVASIADRVIDTLTVLALVVIALPIAGIPPGLVDVLDGLGRIGLWVLVALVLAVLAGVAAWRMVRATALAAKFQGARGLFSARGSAVALAVAISLGVQSAFVLTNVWLAREVGVTTATAAWFVAWPLSKLVAILPISLGGIGVREAALVTLLVPYGAPSETVLASGILWQSVLIVTGLVGLAFTQLLPRSSSAPAGPSPKEI